MAYVKLLLSSRERKALFRAAHEIATHDYTSTRDVEFADHLCDELDDGGIWNPCILAVVPNRVTKSYWDDSAFPIAYILQYGQDMLPEYSHDLEMIADRLHYTRKRNTGTKSHRPLPPFLTRPDYYGPNWDEVRAQAIERDDGECVSCGTGREEHREKFNQDLHVHHLTPLRESGSYADANELENLATLCWPCHRRLEF